MIKVATDAGGTFTDLVAFDENSGKIYLGKALTTPKYLGRRHRRHHPG